MLKQTLLAALVAASLGMVAAPSTAAPVSVSIDIGPPALRYEDVPAARRGYDWTPGYWAWNGNRNRHNWVAGSWVRSRPGYVYAQPNWVEHNGRWQQQRGAWARGDRDHDGIRNNRDRDRDGDGVPNRRDNAPDNPRRN
jgi:hypothetical protein